MLAPMTLNYEYWDRDVLEDIKWTELPLFEDAPLSIKTPMVSGHRWEVRHCHGHRSKEKSATDTKTSAVDIFLMCEGCGIFMMTGSCVAILDEDLPIWFDIVWITTTRSLCLASDYTGVDDACLI
jgi:hypothetical protein